jgi:hypothetical protein
MTGRLPSPCKDDLEQRFFSQQSILLLFISSMEDNNNNNKNKNKSGETCQKDLGKTVTSTRHQFDKHNRESTILMTDFMEEEPRESQEVNSSSSMKTWWNRFEILMALAMLVSVLFLSLDDREVVQNDFNAVTDDDSNGKEGFWSGSSATRMLAVEPGSELNGVEVVWVENGEAFDENNTHIPRFPGQSYRRKKLNPHKTPKPSKEECLQGCEMSKKAKYLDEDFFDKMDLTDASALLQRFTKARQEWIDNKLKLDYGEYYQKIFFRADKSMGKIIFKEMPDLEPTVEGYKGNGKFASPEKAPTPGTGWKRMARKFRMKFLQVQLGILQERMGNYPCKDRCQQGLRPGTYTKFVWSHGGMSSAAGHGNLHYESYTAVMEAAVFPIFKAVGIDFTARNYAYGGSQR